MFWPLQCHSSSSDENDEEWQHERGRANNTSLTPKPSLPTLKPSEPYDLIFIDAQKSGYPSYLSTILASSQKDGKNRLLRAGGLIVADNVLRRGIVADDSDENPWVQREKGERAAYWKSEDVDKLREFNSAVHDEPRLDSWLMPLYDGVHLARLVD